MDVQATFIENLKYYRGIRKISQAKLAELCNVKPGTIGCIEVGRQCPSFDLLCRIAAALNINPADLFSRDATNAKNLELMYKLSTLPQNYRESIELMIIDLSQKFSTGKSVLDYVI